MLTTNQSSAETKHGDCHEIAERPAKEGDTVSSFRANSGFVGDEQFRAAQLKDKTH